jgi:hypothetical protein
MYMGETSGITVQDLKNYSFERGMDQVTKGRIKEVTAKLYEAFELKSTSRYAFSCRLKGSTIPRIDQYHAVEKIFREEGIVDIWGPSQSQKS